MDFFEQKHQERDTLNYILSIWGLIKYHARNQAVIISAKET